MKIKQLIAELQKHDSNLEVLCSSEDKDVLAQGHGFRLFEIEQVAATDATKTRLDGRPYFKLGAGPNSQRHVVLEITTNA